MDNQETSIYKDTVTRVIELMQQTFGSYFHTYYKGIPSQTPPEGAFPCAIVYKEQSAYAVGATMADDFDEVIMIHLLSNRADGAGAPDIVDTVMRELEEIVEARDATTAQFKAGTLMYALRFNLTLNASVINSVANINYVSTPRPGMPFVAEADIKLSLTERVLVPNRT